MTDPGQTEPQIETPEATPAELEDADVVVENEPAEAIEVDMDTLVPRVEAVLVSFDRPMPPRKIGDTLGIPSAKPINEAIEILNAFYTETNRSFRIEKLAGGYQILTLPEFQEAITSLHRTKADSRLSPAALETLAIVSYKQPILRAEIEAIRGVSCGEVLRSLMDKHLVKIAGRADEIGRPILYGTTKRFLEVFGLASLRDLPKVEELTKP